MNWASKLQLETWDVAQAVDEVREIKG